MATVAVAVMLAPVVLAVRVPTVAWELWTAEPAAAAGMRVARVSPARVLAGCPEQVPTAVLAALAETDSHLPQRVSPVE